MIELKRKENTLEETNVVKTEVVEKSPLNHESETTESSDTSESTDITLDDELTYNKSIKDRIIALYAKIPYIKFIPFKYFISAIAAVILVVILLPIVYAIYAKAQLSLAIASADKFYTNGQYAKAIKEYEDIYFETGDMNYQYELGKAYFLNKENVKANKIFGALEKTWEVSDDNAAKISEMYTIYGITELLLDNKVNAEKKIRKALQNDNGYLPAHFFKGCLGYVFAQENINVEGANTSFLKVKNFLKGNEDTAINSEEKLVMSKGRRACFSNLHAVSKSVALNYSGLKNSGYSNKWGFAFPVGAFDNNYAVDFNLIEPGAEDKYFVETIDLLEVNRFLRIGSNAKAIKKLKEIKDGKSLIYNQYNSYVAMVIDGDIKRASDLYKTMSKKYNNQPHFYTMYGNSIVALADGDYPLDEVIPIYEEAIQGNPNNPVTLNNLLHFYLYLGKIKLAESLINESNANKKNSGTKLTMNKALLDIFTGKNEDAEFKLFSVSNKKGEDVSFVYDALIYVVISKGEISKGISLLKKSAQETVDTPELRLKIADLFDKRPQPFLVVEELESAYRKFPNSKEIGVRLLFEYARRNNIKEFNKNLNATPIEVSDNHYMVALAKAIVESDMARSLDHFYTAYGRATDVQSKNRVLTFWARRLLEQQGSMEQMEDAYQFFEEVNEENFSTEIEIISSRILQRINKISKSKQAKLIDLAKSLIDKGSPISPDFKLDLGWILLSSGEKEIANEIADNIAGKLPNNDRYTMIKKALERVDAVAGVEVVEETEENYELLDLLGGLNTEELEKRLSKALAKNDYTVAIAIYTRLIDEGSTTKPALTYQNRGALYLKNEDYESAQKDFKKAFDLGELSDTQIESILYNSSYALSKLKKYKKAREAIIKALEIQPDNIQYLILLAFIDNRIPDNVEILIKTYLKLIKLQPKGAQYYIALSKIYNKTGELKKVTNILNKGIGQMPRNTTLYKRLSDVYTLRGDIEKAKEYSDILKVLQQQ